MQHVPVLYDLAVVVQPEDVDSGPGMIAGPFLPAVQHHVVAFGDQALELDALAGIVAGRLLEIVDEALFAVGDTRIVLNASATA